MTTQATEIKRRTREQWGSDPCGAVHGSGYSIGTREFFDSVEAHRYGEFGPWMPSVMEFDAFAGLDLLEVGCGMGTDLLQFARGGARVTGLDYTPRSVEITRRRFAVYGMPGRFLVGDAENMAFPDDAFDVVYSHGVLHHTPDTQRAIDEVYRVLRPGGVAKIMLYHRNSIYYWLTIILRFGILRGELVRSTPEEIMSRYVEYSETGAMPLVRAYSRRDAAQMFSKFGECRTDVRQLLRGELYLPKWVVPDRMLPALGSRWGWNLVITARK